MTITKINPRILLSGATILAAAAVIIGATLAFFSDTETSSGNTFAAGAIDLTIDNESYATNELGILVPRPQNSWELSDLTNQLFFSFGDVKPGDFGEDTISIHVTDNDAYACMAVDMTSTPENGIVGPEADAGDVTDGEDGGELQNYLEFAFWHDDGDNVYEEGEEIFWEGTADELFDGEWAAIADSETGDGPLTGAVTAYVAKAWCFGTLTENPVAQDENADGNPIDNGTGFTCDGAGDGDQNDAQTDSIEADISFYAIQSRSNPDFLCGDLPPFVGGEEPGEELIGAALGAYVQPSGEDCDVTVTDEESIQDAIDDAGTVDGDTVCVEEGTYNEDVTIDKEITLSGDGASATSIINGQTAAVGGTVVIAADNVTVEGFVINGAGGTSQDASVYISGARSGITVQSNALNAGTGGLALLAEGGQSNHTIQNNILDGDASPQIAYVNGTASVSVASTNVDFLSNTFQGSVVVGGLPFGLEASASDVMKNVFDITSSFSVVETWAIGISLNMNNFNGAGGIKVTHSENVATGDTGTLDAVNNWWGDADASDNVDGEPIDFDPEAVAPFPEN